MSGRIATTYQWSRFSLAMLLMLVAAPLTLRGETVGVELSPRAAQVGDVLTLKFPDGSDSIVLAKKEGVEQLGFKGRAVSLRSFRAGDQLLSGSFVHRGRPIRFTRLFVRVNSVLKGPEDLKPAPLAPLQNSPDDNIARASIAAAAATTILIWLAVWLMRRRPTPVPLSPLESSPDLATLMSRLGPTLSPEEQIALADAVRSTLAGELEGRRDFTTAELLRASMTRLSAAAQDAAFTLLRQGDLAKFSPWRISVPSAPFVAAASLLAARNRAGSGSA